MGELESVAIDSVAVAPDHCHRCGAEVGTCEFEGREYPWCSECELVLSRNPVPGVHVVVHDDEYVLVLDEPIPQHEGVLSLPGGHARYDEGPKEAVVRELEEETGLRADPSDLRFLTILHAEFPGLAYYLITYALERSNVSGELTPEAEGFEAAFRPLQEIEASPDRIRDSDLERIEMAFET
ncbi:NUDIX hydrolase [Haladaptatus sp. NG-WS-4]